MLVVLCQPVDSSPGPLASILRSNAQRHLRASTGTRYSPGSDSWEKAVAARGALPLTVEDQLLLSVKPKQPIWDLGTVPLATAILPQCCPSSHPALAMLSSATSSDVEAEASFLPASGSHFPIPLPQGALTRWAAGLHARSRPRHSGYNGSRVHGAREWAPLWSNPTLQLNSFPTAALCHGLLLHRHTPAEIENDSRKGDLQNSSELRLLQPYNLLQSDLATKRLGLR